MLPVLLASLLAVSCGVSNPPKQSDSHLQRGDVAAPPASRSAAIPQVSQTTYLPQPQAVPQGAETYTVVVNQVPVRDLLFALARDSEINIDIASGIEGQVTLNAIDQTLLQILDRIMLQVPLRYQLKDDLLLIMADEPYLHSYKVDYLNMERSSTSRVALATRVGTVGSADVTDASGGASVNDNNSEASIENLSRNEFWDTLITNVAAIMGLEDLEEADESVHGNTQVIVNREAGYLSARASGRQHREIQHYIDQITASARRQVLIEATIVEVTLNDTFQAGIDWQILGADPTGFDITQSLLGANLAATPFFSFSYTDPSTDAGEVTATVKALEQFGDVQVLSSPKIIALNNQTAILKVVDNVVYFTSEVQTQTTDNTDRTIFQTTVHTVPVGFVMNVTPFISEVEEIILNVRPTISRVVGTVKDPNPALANSDPPVESEIPEIQVREMESMLRVGSGQIAVIGGLMQDKVDKKTSGVPFLSSLPLIGPAFTYRDDQVLKTELIVFLRPRVIHVADVGADLSDFRQYLPQARTPDELREAAGKHLQQ
ncbi:MAG: pilus (MSHA type) biogenesis protein MshL [Gammaproteobacteria bacterium]|nr:pilus (MSHA type) biogenesis protein MshL [Gammaproteobacteria bacterium]